MNLKRILVATGLIATEIMASQSGNERQALAQSWYAKLMTYWERLGTHVQLTIQLVLVLLTIYAITCFLKCDKKCGCVGSGCNCSQVENKCSCGQPNCTCHLNCTKAPHQKCNVKCECKPSCDCGSGCKCDEGCTCGKDCNCGSECNCGCQDKN